MYEELRSGSEGLKRGGEGQKEVRSKVETQTGDGRKPL